MSERQHGKLRYKLDGCRCFDCRLAYSTYQSECRAGRGALLVDYVPAGPVTDHIHFLSQQGIGYRRLADLSGVHARTLRRWRYEGTGVVSKALAAKVLAVGPEAAAPRWQEALGTQRRIMALSALGWPVVVLADRIGWRQANFMQLLRRSGVQRATERKVAGLYDELSMVVPDESLAVKRARLRARRDMWFPPLAWDDDDLDNPEALPCLLPPVGPCARDVELVVQHLAAGHDVTPTPEVRREVVRRTPDRPPAWVAGVARCSVDRIWTLRQELAAAC